MKNLLILVAVLVANTAVAQRYEPNRDIDYESIVRLNAGVGLCATSDTFIKKSPMFYSFGMQIGGGIAFIGIEVKAPVSMFYQEGDSAGKIIRFPAGDLSIGFTMPRRLTPIFNGTGGGIIGSIGARTGGKFYPDAPLGIGGFAQLCANYPYPIFDNMSIGATAKVNYVAYMYQRKIAEQKSKIVYNWVPQIELMLTIGFLARDRDNYHKGY